MRARCTVHHIQGVDQTPQGKHHHRNSKTNKLGTSAKVEGARKTSKTERRRTKRGSEIPTGKGEYANSLPVPDWPIR